MEISRSNKIGVDNLPKVFLVIAVAFLSMIIPVALGLGSKYLLGIDPPTSTQTIVAILLGIFIYAGFLLFSLFPRLASWATTKRRVAGIAPAALSDLQNRLLAINSLDLPFAIQPGAKPNELVAVWKVADTKWAGLMFAGGLKFIYKLTMRFNEQKQIVRARETQIKASWDASGPVPIIKTGLHFSFFQGINLLTFQSAQLGGLLFKDGQLRLDRAYKYTFNPNEVKNPIAQIITQSGWDFVPVAHF